MDSVETVLFTDAVHPVHGAQPVGCWAPCGVALAVEQTAVREHLTIHGAIDLESGTTQMLLVASVDPPSTIALHDALERRFPANRPLHVYLDNARCPIAPSWSGNGWRAPSAASDCASSRPITRISARSSGTLA